MSTSTVTNITVNTASSGGNITSDGGAEVTARGVCWSANENPTISDSKTTDGGGTGQFVSDIAGLTAGLTYHVRAYATNSVGTAYGANVSFTSLGETPECITQPATNITSSEAALNGTVNANYISTTVTFEYGTTTDYGQTVNAAQSPVTGSSITPVSADITGLQAGITYHFRIKTENSLGTTYGNDLTFTTALSIPTLTTTPVSNPTSNSATIGGNITSDGGAAITARGVCWATTPNPTIDNEITTDGSGTGSFTSMLACLSDETIYYVRAYATNSEGTAYGDQQTFTTEPSSITFNPDLTYGTVMDIDGNCYKTIQIGGQTWMAENLKTSKYNDGSPIPNVTDDIEWTNLYYEIEGDRVTSGAFCWYNNDSATYENDYGKLYNWGTVATGKLCPLGWHVSSFNEWERLNDWSNNIDEFYSGDPLSNNVLGGPLLETGTAHWDFHTLSFTTNETGFTALPSGRRSFQDGSFYGSATFHTTTSYGQGAVMFYYIPHSSLWDHLPSWVLTDEKEGLAIRCLKDQ